MHLSRPIIGAAATLAVMGATLAPSDSAVAQPQPTINAAPNPTTTGDPLVIFGRASAGARVVLWHRVNPAHRYTPVQRTTATATGLYQFARKSGVVTTNRNWFVVVGQRRSRVVHQRVFALATINGPASTNLVTGMPFGFSGQVSPAHTGQRVLLQRQNSQTGRGWYTIHRGRIGADGAYTIVHRFTVAGDANIRVLFPGDRRNIASPSDTLSYQISQKQNPAVTIASSANPIDEGQSATISGQVAGVSTPRPVTLLARTARQARFMPVATAMTDAAGAYSFTPTPVVNTFYKVQAKPKHSAVLYEGVRDVVTAAVDQTNVVAGATLTFTGSVAPDKTGHVIYLQRHNANGNGWHTIEQGTVQPGSTFALTHRVTVAGQKQFRVLIPGGPINQRGVSQTFTVTVAPNPTPLS